MVNSIISSSHWFSLHVSEEDNLITGATTGAVAYPIWDVVSVNIPYGMLLASIQTVQLHSYIFVLQRIAFENLLNDPNGSLQHFTLYILQL